MTDDLIPAPELPRLPVLDDRDRDVGRFPVGRVFCVGRNYQDHAREMGHDPDREPPFFFMKPATAVVGAGRIRYPAFTADLHHEVELVLAVRRAPDVAHVDVDGVLDCVLACAVGIDFTRRDLQAEAKDARRPWEAGKVFDGAAPCGPLRIGRSVLDAPEAAISLDVDGRRRQSGTLGQMIWTPAEVLLRIDALFGLRPGDLVFTGTPAGVAAVAPGARLRACVEGLPPLDVVIDAEGTGPA